MLYSYVVDKVHYRILSVAVGGFGQLPFRHDFVGHTLKVTWRDALVLAESVNCYPLSLQKLPDKPRWVASGIDLVGLNRLCRGKHDQLNLAG